MRVRPLLLAVGLLACAAPVRAEPPALTVCVDPKPAASATQRVGQGAPGAEPAPTFSMELFGQVFQRMGRPMRFVTDQPWARCLLSVARGEVDFALGGYYNEARAQVYAFSRPYMTLTPMLFSQARRPVRAEQVGQLKGLRGCGMIGASYSHYDLDSSALDLGVNSYPKLFEKLLLDRCDYVPEELEVVAGMQVQGREVLGHPQLLGTPARWARGPTKHLLAAKQGPAAALLPQVDQALAQLIRDGAAAALWTSHTPGVPYRP